jgi:hypothetical protein
VSSIPSPDPSPQERGKRLAFFDAVGNHSGRRAPVACRIGAITRAISSGADSTNSRIAGPLSKAANAAPSRRTSGEKPHIQPNPRGRRSSGGKSPRSGGTDAASRRERSGKVTVSPAASRRVSASSAATRLNIQLRARPRATGATGGVAVPSAGAACTRPNPGPATRRTTAFTRFSRVMRSGAENILGSFSGRQALLARRYEKFTQNDFYSQ